MNLKQFWQDETGQFSWGRLGASTCLVFACLLAGFGRKEYETFLKYAATLYLGDKGRQVLSKVSEAIASFSDKQDKNQDPPDGSQ